MPRLKGIIYLTELEIKTLLIEDTYSKIYMYKNKIWKLCAVSCVFCNKTYTSTVLAKKHIDKCMNTDKYIRGLCDD